ncbi:hypothetical protein K435DRAFT_635021, partial [Dendrothele bispora CBS 962.96]
FGKLFEKVLSLRTGQCNVKMSETIQSLWLDMIISGRAKRSFAVSHNVPLDKADKFDKRIEGYTKVLLH